MALQTPVASSCLFSCPTSRTVAADAATEPGRVVSSAMGGASVLIASRRSVAIRVAYAPMPSRPMRPAKPNPTPYPVTPGTICNNPVIAAVPISEPTHVAMARSAR